MLKSSLFFALTAAMMLLVGCSLNPSGKQGSQVEINRNISSNQEFEIVPNDLVCMVNDRYMGIKQIPIEAEGIIYYGCCEGCVQKLKENIGNVRYGTDPISKQKVDKALAVIVRNKADGLAYYFESAANANAFLSQ